jgi:hypothetical protein
VGNDGGEHPVTGVADAPDEIGGLGAAADG